MTKPKIIPRSVKHTFTPEEREDLSNRLVNALATLQSTDKEFDAVKSSFKARIAECESQVNTIAANIRAGFEMRVKDCVIIYDAEKGEKGYFLISDYKRWEENHAEPIFPVLTEKMTDDDYQQELIQAEADFNDKETIELFPPTADDRGELVMGVKEDRWHAALRIKIGLKELTQRLDTEQMNFKTREDAVKHSVKLALRWLKENTGDAWKGFEAAVKAIAQ